MATTSRKISKRERTESDRAQVFYEDTESDDQLSTQEETRPSKKMKRIGSGLSQQKKKVTKPSQRKPATKRMLDAISLTDEDVDNNSLVQTPSAKKPKTDDENEESVSSEILVNQVDGRGVTEEPSPQQPNRFRAPDPPTAFDDSVGLSTGSSFTTGTTDIPTYIEVPSVTTNFPATFTDHRVSLQVEQYPPDVPVSTAVSKQANDSVVAELADKVDSLEDEEPCGSIARNLGYRAPLLAFLYVIGVISALSRGSSGFRTARAFSGLSTTNSVAERNFPITNARLPTSKALSMGSPSASDISDHRNNTFGSTRPPTCFADAGIDADLAYDDIPQHCLTFDVRPPCPGTVCQRDALVSCGPYAKPTLRHTMCALLPRAPKLATNMYEILHTSTKNCQLNDLHCKHPFFAGLDSMDNRPLFYYDEIVEGAGAGGTHPSILYDLNKNCSEELFSMQCDDTTGRVAVSVIPSIAWSERATESVTRWTWTLLETIGSTFGRFICWLFFICLSAAFWTGPIVAILGLLYAFWILDKRRKAYFLQEVDRFRQRALHEIYDSRIQCAQSDQVLARIVWELFPSSPRQRDNFEQGIWQHVVQEIHNDPRVFKTMGSDTDGKVVIHWMWIDSMTP